MPALTRVFLLLASMFVVPAHADVVVVTYGAPGTFNADFSTLCSGGGTCDYGVENFSGWSGGGFTSNFTDGAHKSLTAGVPSTTGGVTFSGTYTATDGTTYGTTLGQTGKQWVAEPANEFGGEPYPGGRYPELYGPGSVGGGPTGQTQSSYTLKLSSTNEPSGATTGINYFGVWISALDPYNDLLIYNTTGQVIAQFDSSVLLAALGTCTVIGGHAANPYCGNPEDGGADPGELFAFVNVYDLTGTIGSVQFFDSGSTGFESSNDTVAYVDPIVINGTALDIPEPSSLAVFAVGLLGLIGLRRRPRPRYFAGFSASSI
jgi:hypothetical protein